MRPFGETHSSMVPRTRGMRAADLLSACEHCIRALTVARRVSPSRRPLSQSPGRRRCNCRPAPLHLLVALPPDQRSAVLAHHVDGESYEHNLNAGELVKTTIRARDNWHGTYVV